MTRQEENYLYKLATMTLKWADVEYSEEEVWDLVMLDLCNVKKES